MRENKILSILAGIILGIIFGCTYYGTPLKCLVTGNMQIDGLFIPEELNRALVWESFKWGGGIGAIIGSFSGLISPITLPRGYLSKSISCLSFIVCTIAAFVMYGGRLFQMSGGRIFVTFLYVFILLCLAIPLGDAFSFIEKIRKPIY